MTDWSATRYSLDNYTVQPAFSLRSVNALFSCKTSNVSSYLNINIRCTSTAQRRFHFAIWLRTVSRKEYGPETVVLWPFVVFDY